MIHRLPPPHCGEAVVDPATGWFRWVAEHFDSRPIPVTLLALDNGRGGADVLFAPTAAYEAVRRRCESADPLGYGEVLWAALQEIPHWSPGAPRADAEWHALPADFRAGLRDVHARRPFPYALPRDEDALPRSRTDLAAISLLFGAAPPPRGRRSQKAPKAPKAYGLATWRRHKRHDGLVAGVRPRRRMRDEYAGSQRMARPGCPGHRAVSR